MFDIANCNGDFTLGIFDESPGYEEGRAFQLVQLLLPLFPILDLRASMSFSSQQ